MAPKNRQLLLASRPGGEPAPDSFRPVKAEAPRPGTGRKRVIVRPRGPTIGLVLSVGMPASLGRGGGIHYP